MSWRSEPGPASGFSQLAQLVDMESVPSPSPATVVTPSAAVQSPESHRQVVARLVDQQRQDLLELHSKMRNPTPLTPQDPTRHLNAPALQQTRAELEALRRANEQLVLLHQQEMAGMEREFRDKRSEEHTEHLKQMAALQRELEQNKQEAAREKNNFRAELHASKTSNQCLQEQVTSLEKELSQAFERHKSLEQNLQEANGTCRSYEAALESSLSLLSNERDSLFQENLRIRNWAQAHTDALRHSDKQATPKRLEQATD
eukprot:TRINITY_DN18569_c0_g1_i2.p1 TRINITY_DN18569_c0_g1~~TRINITY_DN18569_c0_g1_i2.p1  ORF type:complete len:259 (+),score=49.96 TRINITY_DN18569_c0_g1_i2:274-1050(+)